MCVQRLWNNCLFLSDWRTSKAAIDSENSHSIGMGIRQTCKSQLISTRENGTELLAFTIELMSESSAYSRWFAILYWENAFWNASSRQSNRGKLNHQHYKQQKTLSFEQLCCLLTKSLLGKVFLDIQVLYNVFQKSWKSTGYSECHDMRRQLYLSEETSTINRSLLSFFISDLSREHHCNCQDVAFFVTHVKTILRKLDLLASLSISHLCIRLCYMLWCLTSRWTQFDGFQENSINDNFISLSTLKCLNPNLIMFTSFSRSLGRYRKVKISFHTSSVRKEHVCSFHSGYFFRNFVVSFSHLLHRVHFSPCNRRS